VNEFFGVLTIGMFVGMTFIVFLVYGALLGNNPHVDKAERIWWYTLFAIAGPIALPAYWFKQVWPAAYEPILDDGKLAPARSVPPSKREASSTQVLPPGFAH
jgi:H+/Cl- antiporter ClcA